MAFNLDTESESPDRTTLHLHGRLDAQTFNDFDSAMLDVLPRVAEGGTVVLDLSALEYISSAGLRSIAMIRRSMSARGGHTLRSIAMIRRSMRARGGHTLLLNPQPQVRKV